jgi:hypothetical protein
MDEIQLMKNQRLALRLFFLLNQSNCATQLIEGIKVKSDEVEGANDEFNISFIKS